MHINMCGVATYENTIAYNCSNEVLFFKFKEVGNSLLPANSKPKITQEEQFESARSTCNQMPCHEYAITAMKNSSRRFDKLLDFNISKKCSDALRKYESGVYGTPAIDELEALISEIADSPIQILNRKSDTRCFKPDIISMQSNNEKPGFLENQIDGIGVSKDVSIQGSSAMRSLMPSPRMMQYDYNTQKMEQQQATEEIKKCLFDKEENKHELPNECVEEIRNSMRAIRKQIKSINKYSKKSFELKDAGSESDEEELFFDYPENEMLKQITHPLLREIPKFKRVKKQVKQTSILHIFKKVLSKYGIKHPATYSMPIDKVKRKAVNAIILSKQYTSYRKSFFFVKNHMDFFKRRFAPRDIKEPERPVKGWIDGFVQEEFNRIVGCTPNKAVEQQSEVIKKKRGGF